MPTFFRKIHLNYCQLIKYSLLYLSNLLKKRFLSQVVRQLTATQRAPVRLRQEPLYGEVAEW